MEGLEKLRQNLCHEAKISEEEVEFRKVEKVLTPFLWARKKKKHGKTDRVPSAYEDLYLKRNPQEILVRLQKGFSDPVELKTLMNETAQLLKVVTKSKNVNLYLTDYDRGELHLCPKYVQRSNRFQKKYTIGTYVAAHVAFTKEYILSSDILGDVRFPLGIPDVPAVKSVICLPIITNMNENCIGVIELYRECSEKPYDLINLQICNALTAWMGIAVEQNNGRLSVLQKLETQKELCQLAGLYFSGILPFSKTVSDFLKVLKTTVKAEKAAFYVFPDPVPPNAEGILTADAYEEGSDDTDDTILYKKSVRVRFVKDEPGVAGYVARTGKILNIHDAYKDHRFDKKSDSPFFRTRSLAAFPIKTVNGVLAVLHLINRFYQPGFREDDIELTESLLPQITMLCEYNQISGAHVKTQLRLELANEILDLSTKSPEEELSKLKHLPLLDQSQLPPGFLKFDWEPINFESDAFLYIMNIFQWPDILESRLDLNNLADFLLRVSKFYRPSAFHNFEHAFSVLHFAFNILLRVKDMYTTAEMVAIFVVAICHDVDHRGLTNTFMTLQNDISYRLYGDFCGEIHRWNVIAFLIQKTNLLSNFSSEDYKLILKNVEKLMVGLNLAMHFQHRKAIVKFLNIDSFKWMQPQHRLLTQNMILVCSDNASRFKSFDFVKKYTTLFYRELHRQGDLERSMGYTPLPMMDRDKFEQLPENEVILITYVVLPVVDILVRLFPSLNVLDDLIRKTLKEWSDIIHYRGTPIWRMKDALLRDKKERRVTTKVTNASSTFSSLRTGLW